MAARHGVMARPSVVGLSRQALVVLPAASHVRRSRPSVDPGP